MSRYDEQLLEIPTAHPVHYVQEDTNYFVLGNGNQYSCYLNMKNTHGFHASSLQGLFGTVNNMADSLNFLIINQLFKRKTKNDEKLKEKQEHRSEQHEFEITNTELLAQFTALLNTDRQQYVKEIKTILETYISSRDEQLEVVKQQLERINSILNSTTEHDWQKGQFKELNNHIQAAINSSKSQNKELIQSNQQVIDQLRNLSSTKKEEHVIDLQPILDRLPSTKERAKEIFDPKDGDIFHAANFASKVWKNLESVIVPTLNTLNNKL